MATESTYLPKLKLMGRCTANKYIFKDGLTQASKPPCELNNFSFLITAESRAKIWPVK